MNDLQMINIYESFTEYLTIDKIDFMYVVNSKLNFSLMSIMELAPLPSLLAQWTRHNEPLERKIKYLGQKVIEEKDEPFWDLDFS